MEVVVWNGQALKLNEVHFYLPLFTLFPETTVIIILRWLPFSSPLSRSHSQDLLFSRVTSTDLAVDFTKSDNPDAAIACRAPPHPSHTLHSSQSSVHVLEASFTRQAESSPFRGTPEVYTYTPSFSDTFTVKQGSDLILFDEERYSLLVSTHYSYTTLTTRRV